MCQPETMGLSDRGDERGFAKGRVAIVLELVVTVALALVACLLVGCATTAGAEGVESNAHSGGDAEAAMTDEGNSSVEATDEIPPVLMVADAASAGAPSRPGGFSGRSYHGHTNCHCPVRSHACCCRNHRVFSGEAGVMDGADKEEAGQPAKVDPA